MGILVFIYYWSWDECRESRWWYVNIGSGNDLVPTGDMPSSEPMLTKIYSISPYGVTTPTPTPHWIKLSQYMRYNALNKLSAGCTHFKPSVVYAMSRMLLPDGSLDKHNIWQQAIRCLYGGIASLWSAPWTDSMRKWGYGWTHKYKYMSVVKMGLVKNICWKNCGTTLLGF